MIKESKVGQYLLYAIGEIFLVVIGILIAVQIGDWNDERLQNTQRIELLESLKDDFSQSFKQIKIQLQQEKEKNATLKQLLNYSAGAPIDIPTDTLLDKLQSVWLLHYFNSYMTTFEQAKSSGKLSLIKSRNLLNSLSDLEVSLAGLQSVQIPILDKFGSNEYSDIRIHTHVLEGSDKKYDDNNSPLRHPDYNLNNEDLIAYIRTPLFYSKMNNFYTNKIYYEDWVSVVQTHLDRVLIELDNSLLP